MGNLIIKHFQYTTHQGLDKYCASRQESTKGLCVYAKNALKVFVFFFILGCFLLRISHAQIEIKDLKGFTESRTENIPLNIAGRENATQSSNDETVASARVFKKLYYDLSPSVYMRKNKRQNAYENQRTPRVLYMDGSSQLLSDDTRPSIQLIVLDIDGTTIPSFINTQLSIDTFPNLRYLLFRFAHNIDENGLDNQLTGLKGKYEDSESKLTVLYTQVEKPQ